MNNFEFTSINLKEPPKKRPVNIPRRDIRGIDNDFVLVNKRIEHKESPVFILPIKSKETLSSEKNNYPFFNRQVFIRAGAVALVGLFLIGLVEGIGYFSSAKNASTEILGVSTSAYGDLKTAQQNLQDQNFSSALDLFNSAENSLNLAQEKLNNFKVVKWIIPQAQSADFVLTGAGLLAQSGEKVTAALSLFNEIKVSSKGIETLGINEKIFQNRQLLSESLSLIERAENNFSQAKNLPEEYNATIEQAMLQVKSLHSILENLIGLEDIYLSLFFDSNKTYLLIFQNYDETRATGGFIGTYGVLKINNGQIAKLKIDSVYNLDGNIYERIAAPGPMQPLIKKWGMRDANWFVDFRQSANTLLKFFEKGQETADGVIAITPKLFEELLTIVGPIQMPAYGVELTAQNFQEMVQFKTSVDYDPVLNQPKKFLADFAPILLEKFSNLEKTKMLEVLQTFEQALKTRQILLFSKENSAQEKFEQMGFSGAVLPTDKDYLSVVNTNLGGTKVDLEINQKVDLQSKLLSDGSVINELTITRENPTEQIDKNYLRVLVPKGSSLISAFGFDNLDYYASVSDGYLSDPDLAAWDKGEEKFNKIYVREEAGKTEFAGWVNLATKSSRVVKLAYVLPFKFAPDFISNSDSYSLLLQKQAGSKPMEFQGSLVFGKYKSKWLSSGATLESDSIKYRSSTNLDDFWSAVLTK
jgi:hypothetical protein